MQTITRLLGGVDNYQKPPNAPGKLIFAAASELAETASQTNYLTCKKSASTQVWTQKGPSEDPSLHLEYFGWDFKSTFDFTKAKN